MLLFDIETNGLLEEVTQLHCIATFDTQTSEERIFSSLAGDLKDGLALIMKEMAGLANALQVVITFVSHLATPEGKPHEEGGHVSIRHFKGSRSIGFWSYFMFGLERDQQSEDLALRQTTTFRVLKDRYTGQATGSLLYLGYDATTGRLGEVSKPLPTGTFKDETETNSDF